MHPVILAAWQKYIATVGVSNIVEGLEDLRKKFNYEEGRVSIQGNMQY